MGILKDRACRKRWKNGTNYILYFFFFFLKEMIEFFRVKSYNVQSFIELIPVVSGLCTF